MRGEREPAVCLKGEYTDAVSFVTASVSMPLQNRVVLKTLSIVERFQNDTVSIGFNGETASI